MDIDEHHQSPDARQRDLQVRELRRKRLAVITLAPYRINTHEQTTWLDYGFFACPGSKSRKTCSAFECGVGSSCRKTAELGLRGDGVPLPKRDLPKCGAKTRVGGTCNKKVVPGKRRCILHGGLSTGPKTKEGKERILAGVRDRHRRLGR